MVASTAITGSSITPIIYFAPFNYISGDDFTYSNDAEWDQQYSNYKQIMDYINANYYNAQIQWVCNFTKKETS